MKNSQLTLESIPAKSEQEQLLDEVNEHETENLNLALKKGHQVIHVASFGCGVDSVAGLLFEGFAKYHEVIFADTGSEKKGTYEYLEYLTKTLGWNITVLKSRYGNIYDYYYKKRIYPTMFARDCTGKFKIDVINGYLRKKYGKKAHFIVSLYIDYNEATERLLTSKYRYTTLKHPLVEYKLTRDDCIQIIKDHNMPVPVKSGCFFCPFTPAPVWRKMKTGTLQEQEDYKKAKAMEDNSIMRKKREYPLIRLKGKNDKTLQACGCFNYNINTENNEQELAKLWHKGFSM